MNEHFHILKPYLDYRAREDAERFEAKVKLATAKPLKIVPKLKRVAK